MDTNKGLGKHEELLSGWGTGSMGWTGFPFQGGVGILWVWKLRKAPTV